MKVSLWMDWSKEKEFILEQMDKYMMGSEWMINNMDKEFGLVAMEILIMVSL